MSNNRKSYLFIFVFVCNLLHSDAADNYGPYSVSYDGHENCAGPKSKNLTRYVVDMVKDGENYILKLNLTFLEQCFVNEVKITAFVVDTNINRKKLLLNYKITDPCHHYAFANLINIYLNTTKCLVKKGTYDVVVNLSDVSKSFLSSAFFYGEFLMKAIITSKKGNILCLVIKSIYRKKTQ